MRELKIVEFPITNVFCIIIIKRSEMNGMKNVLMVCITKLGKKKTLINNLIKICPCKLQVDKARNNFK